MASTHTRVPAEGRRLQIIEVATALFARQGFNGTTTRQIAQRAGVNEAIIFRHFPTKEDLYWAVIESQCSVRGTRATLEARLVDDSDPAEALTAVAEDFLRRDTTLTRLLLFTALEKHELSDRFYRTHVARYFELLADYVRRNIDKGAFRVVDPLLAARSFIGMLFHHFHVQELYGGKKYQQFDVTDVARTLVDVWLRGVQAPGPDRVSARGDLVETSHRND
ncbi:MAG: TetR/AcrR family transcriptional regulator [Terriglobales bacterium]